MANKLKQITVNNKSLGDYDGVKIKITKDLYEVLEKRKTQQGNMITNFKKGRALRGFKHLVETIKTKNKEAEIIFTHESTKRAGKKFYINFEDYRRKTSGRFYSLYRETGLDGAKYFLNENFKKDFEYDKTHITEKQLKKIEKQFPRVVKDLSKKSKNQTVLIKQTTEVVKNLKEKKKILKKEIEAFEQLQNQSNITIFQKRLDELSERIDKNYSETKGANSWQKWIYTNNWLFGIQYQKPIEKQRVGFNSIPDYLFPTIDGFLDILEIKLPTVDVIISDESHPGTFKWSSKTSEAIGQVVNYLHEIELHQLELQQKIQRKYKEEFTSGIFSIKPRAFILIGLKKDWEEEKIEALRKLNYSLHGIEVLTYTDLIVRGQQIIEMYSKKIEN
ncbi:MAG: Shedu anti-phage system protein SduA domain-containing protein [Candidatus Scalinduaceae bacterium]